ncbi:MAG: hypothetical protein DRP08_07490 [Candidatus Aenigmatarchaeota archaeon]|nr:MAG: hypothetical protein DRP08_07490 [Candidatus Aenigmarchaeota archaeon]
MGGTWSGHWMTAERIYRIKEQLDDMLIEAAINAKVVTPDNYVVRDILPKTDFGSTYYDNEEWETAQNIGGDDWETAVNVSLDGDKLIGFYGALGPSTQGVVAIRFKEGDAVKDVWQVQSRRVGLMTSGATSGTAFEEGFLAIVGENEQIIYAQDSNIVIDFYGTASAAADDTTVLLGRVIERPGKNIMGSTDKTRTRAGLLPWFMVTPEMIEQKRRALDAELIRRAREQGIIESDRYVLRDILPNTDFGSTYYAHEDWEGAISLTASGWKTIISVDLDSDKLIGFYGYLGPDDNVTALRFKVGGAIVKDIWMLEQTRMGELSTPSGTATDEFQRAHFGLARTPIIYNGEDTLVVEAYGAVGASGTFKGILLGRVIEPQGRVVS